MNSEPKNQLHIFNLGLGIVMHLYLHFKKDHKEKKSNKKYKEHECERVISLLDRPADHSRPCWGKGRLALQHEVSQRSEDAPQFDYHMMVVGELILVVSSTQAIF